MMFGNGDLLGRADGTFLGGSWDGFLQLWFLRLGSKIEPLHAWSIHSSSALDLDNLDPATWNMEDNAARNCIVSRS